MARPSVDVVVPFRGDPAALRELKSRLAQFRLIPGDTVVVVDNSRASNVNGTDSSPPVSVVRAAERASPGFARNRGALLGRAEWIVFLDSDTEPIEDLLDRFFDPPPAVRTGLLAGGVIDEPIARRGPAAARYAYLQQAMSQRQTFRLQRWAFAQMANAACRRKAFEAVGGFREDIRAGEDADLCYRLANGGWEIERRERAAVVHRNRRTVSAFVAQKALHGAGAAWLDRAYPGSFPRRRRPGLVWWAIRASIAGLVRAAKDRDRDKALLALFDPLEQLAYEFGRTLPNRRPARLRRHRGPHGDRG
jgi:GT2 family glycosyltransferase